MGQGEAGLVSAVSDTGERYPLTRARLALGHTFGRVFAAIDAEEFAAAFQRWVHGLLPALEKNQVVSPDDKTSRRSGKLNATPLHLGSAFAAGAGLVLGQRATT